MQVRRVEVSGPSRLHFGLFPAGAAGQPQFAGAGAMIDRPRLRITVRRSDGGPAVDVADSQARRALEFAQLAARHWGHVGPLPVRIDIHEAPPEHAGLGSGTQLGMAVAAAVARLLGHEPRGPEELAASVGRGRRSAVGLHGFWHGGLLVEGGKLRDAELAPLVTRAALPSAWRFVLLRPRGGPGLSGEAEREVFARVQGGATDHDLAAEVEARLALARHAEAASFDDFCEGLYAYNRSAGEAFAAVQGGPFADEPWISRLRAWGYRGVGQSSWGPTIFVVVPQERHARQLCRRLASFDAELHDRPLIAAGDNRGAVVRAA